ncbi:MAG: tRNA (N6-isopentenyl adenosine(37)-C2)-methylthiotransferase MiaB [Nitrospirae bacterium]|nr:tRNA (N6-isopentenyl adenosine(37)-C2)-methylthiotransferase MiaB [Nitrospirota bacterium]
MKEKLAYLHTWGCQMNVHDSEKIAGVLKVEGYALTDMPEKADLIILNTCSIREKAEQKFYSELGVLRAMKTKRPDMKIGITGCIAQQEGPKLRKSNPHVDFAFGPQNITMLPDLLGGEKFQARVEENPSVHLTKLPAERQDGLKAWINIMYGCNNFCSYCVVPFTRGRERSRPYADVIEEIEALPQSGYKEVTLLGQNVNSYNGNCTFPELLAYINAIDGIERIRFVTSHPKDLGGDLISAMKELDKVCEHIHLPLQSGSTDVLRRMNRKYTYEQYLDGIRQLREQVPGVAITSDIIAGFPGETDEDHEATVSALREIEFDGIFAFKYSKRPYTKAKDLEGQVEEKVKSDRLNHLLKVQDTITERKNRSLEGQTVEVLIEGKTEDYHGATECCVTDGCVADADPMTDPNKNRMTRYTGRTRTNKIVNFVYNGELRTGQLFDVIISRGFKHSLEGRGPDEVQCLYPGM